MNNHNTDSMTGLFVKILSWTHFTNKFPRFLYWLLGVTDDRIAHTQPTWLLVKYKLLNGNT